MKISDVLTEAVPVSAPSNVGRDYINMLNFVKSSGLEGVPADQQVAVALFKELQKQQQKNTQMGRELSAAEQRIDQATQSGELYGQELATHQAELDRERGEIEKQKEKMGQIDQAYAGRAQASEQQMRSLTDQLAQLKSKPGVDKSTAETLQNQIEKLRKEGVDQDKFKELQKNIESIQNMQQVDDRVIQDLVAQIKSAEAAAAGAVQSKQELGQDLEKQLAHFRDVEKTVAALKVEVDKLEADAKQNDQAIVGLSGSINNIRNNVDQAMAARKASNNDPTLPAKMAHKMITPRPPPQRPIWNPDPRELAQKLVDKGVLQSVDESQMARAIAWATGKTK
jgi:chromosome segregation ATPase